MRNLAIQWGCLPIFMDEIGLVTWDISKVTDGFLTLSIKRHNSRHVRLMYLG